MGRLVLCSRGLYRQPALSGSMGGGGEVGYGGVRGIIAVDLGGRQGWWGGDDDPARGTKEMEAKAVPCPLKYYCSKGNFQPRSKL